MTNKELSKKIVKTIATTGHWIWIAAVAEGPFHDISEVLEGFDVKALAAAVDIPELNDIHADDPDAPPEEFAEAFVDQMVCEGKFGFVVEVRIPQRSEFTDRGAYSFSYGICYSVLVYAETREELADKIVAASKKMEEYDRAREAKEATG